MRQLDRQIARALTAVAQYVSVQRLVVNAGSNLSTLAIWLAAPTDPMPNNVGTFAGRVNYGITRRAGERGIEVLKRGNSTEAFAALHWNLLGPRSGPAHAE